MARQLRRVSVVPGRERAGGIAVFVACGLGLVHAAFSLYWAAGGTVLLSTVGQWAVTASRGDVGRLVLLLVTAVKVAAAVIPVLVHRGRIRFARMWRAISWVGAVFLILYGGANVVVGALVLSGVIRSSDGYDADAMIGHTFLWDPLFLLWGAALGLWLVLSRRPFSRT